MLAIALVLALAQDPAGSAAVPAPPAESQPAGHFDTSAWRSLFDGRTLNGWTSVGGHYDGHASWTVEDGLIAGREGPGHAGGLLYTERAYTSFLFAVDVRIDWPFDSGIFLRMDPELRGLQVTIDHRPGGEIGGIYSDGWLQHNPDGDRRLVRDEWNRFEVECTGRDMHVRAWLNGEPLVDFELPEGSEGYAPRGLIGLQVHGGSEAPPGTTVRFRNIRLRELPVFDPKMFRVDERGFLTPTELGRASGWRPLFDGSTLSGWEPVDTQPTDYRAADGVLAFPVAGGAGYLRTTQDFRDFELQLDFKTAYMANSGLFLRGDRAGGDPAYSGCEIQILDDFNWEAVTGSKLEPWQLSGSLYGAIPAGHPGALAELGTWNTYQVRYKGTEIEVWLNGVHLYTADTETLDVEPPFAQRAPAGFIGLQRHAPPQATGEEYAWFRNLFVRPLDED